MIAIGADLAVAVDSAAAILRGGGVIVMPTDTVYGLAALPGEEGATTRLFELKGRGSDAPLAVLCADVERAAALADPACGPALHDVAGHWWPGPLTLVVLRAPGVRLHLGEPAGTVGLRIPDHAFVRALAREVGPIAATSANRHGAPTEPSALAAATSLAGDVDLVVDGGTIEGTASTVVDTTRSPWRVLRSGSLPSEEILGLERGGRL